MLPHKRPWLRHPTSQGKGTSMRTGYCAPSISQTEEKMSCQIMALGWPLQKVNFHHTLTLFLWEKHLAGTYTQILRLLVQWNVICTTYKSTESSFPSSHSSQTKNIPQDGQAYCCHPQGIKGTSERKRGSYRLRSGRQAADSYTLPRQGQRPWTFQKWEELPTPPSERTNGRTNGCKNSSLVQLSPINLFYKVCLNYQMKWGNVGDAECNLGMKPK